MITVLKNRSEVDDALSTLRADELPLHVTPQKNWDHLLIKDLIFSGTQGDPKVPKSPTGV